ncbi:hypothetical protein DFA_08903 [Cavenderia fasciculata]|uniref:Alpha-galactosidase n=1 Tax=Cavenderia fasciculata TaxID=261658 RepID=F4Q4V6_CACFS|nr:uncharacterized protein DFA_08903 [Cavenderia fasciculata]EGG17902.1 hypothetical protein DFA_08903 [Cavenderia fasciculata]|eukprot:XP_004356386.1 hypothetical protein DFA_08903 [Cavenderia fasciculata]
MYKSIILVFTATIIGLSIAVDNGLGLVPQMGWNSWNHFHCDINETVIMESALAMVTSGLKDAGYRYVNIDDCWAVGRDDNGVIQADPIAFPNGIKYIADYVHSLGLLIGIYTDAGILTCQKRPGSYGYEQIDAQTYASWGIDYLKMDWCNTYLENPQERYTIMSKALNATGRPIFFSLCNWGISEPWMWAMDIGNSWRTTGDIADTWTSMTVILDLQVPITSFSGVGGWNDPDMLEVGNGGMTTTEYISHFSLWSLLSAPLIAGNDIRSIDNTTFSILTAMEVIAVNQDTLGRQGSLIKSINGKDQQIWAKPLADGSKAVILLNRNDNESATIQLQWGDIWESPSTSLIVRDLWAQQDIDTFTGSYTATNIPPHGCVMLRVY